jgi:glycosyltransferase involved in cell wall biosynthesis
MSKYYINCNNDKFIDYFKNLDFIITNIEQFNNTTIPEKSIIIYNMENVEQILKKNTTNILLLSKPIINISSVQKFDYYLPIDPNLFLTYIRKFGLKLLFPVNILNKKKFAYNCDDNLYKKYGNQINRLYDKNDYDLYIYDNIDKLALINNVFVKIFRIDEKTINETLFYVNNHFNLANKYIQNNTLYLPEKHNQEIILENKKNSFCRRMSFNNSYQEFQDFEDLEKFNSWFCQETTISNYRDNPILKLEKNKNYLIMRNNTNIHKNITEHLCEIDAYNFKCYSFLIRGKFDFELAIYYQSTSDQEILYCDILKQIEYYDSRIIGNNNDLLTDDDICALYYMYGLNKIYLPYLHLQPYEFKYYECIFHYILGINTIFNQKFNKMKFRKILSFWAGLNNILDCKSLSQNINIYIEKNNDIFNQKKIFLLSKAIIDYGGNQKTAYQLYTDLINSGYDIKICCLTTNELISEIDKYDIFHAKIISDIIGEVNNNDYEYVIVNKLDEFLNIVESINKKKVFITHNSADPINKAILEKSKFLDNVLTVNSEHINLLYENNINCKVNKYINHIDILNNKINKRSNFTNQILYVGRISDEKNVDLLIDSFNIFSEKNTKVQLKIIGDGKLNNRFEKNDNIIFLGRCDRETIIYNLIHSDYLILPSSTEGLPFVFLEAMSLGIPVIASNIIGINEIVKNNERGFLFDFENYDNYKNNIDNWSIINYVATNKNKFVNNIVSILEKAYSISSEQWNRMSELCYDNIKMNYNTSNSPNRNLNTILHNSYALILKVNNKIDEIKEKFKYFDMYNHKNFNQKKYTLILKIDIEKLKHMNTNIILIILNQTKKEMEDKQINKIIDKNNNFILLNNNYTNSLTISSLNDIFYFSK